MENMNKELAEGKEQQLAKEDLKKRYYHYYY